MNNTIIFCYKKDDKNKKCISLPLQDFDPETYNMIYVDIDELRDINKEFKKSGNYVFIKLNNRAEKRIAKKDFDPRKMKISLKDINIKTIDELPDLFINKEEHTERSKTLPLALKYSEEDFKEYYLEKNRAIKEFLRVNQGLENPVEHIVEGKEKKSYEDLCNKNIRLERRLQVNKRRRV